MHEKKMIIVFPRPLVEVLNPDNPYNQGYFGDALKQNKEGYHPRVVQQGKPNLSMLSEALTPETMGAKTRK